MHGDMYNVWRGSGHVQLAEHMPHWLLAMMPRCGMTLHAANHIAHVGGREQSRVV